MQHTLHACTSLRSIPLSTDRKTSRAALQLLRSSLPPLFLCFCSCFCGPQRVCVCVCGLRVAWYGCGWRRVVLLVLHLDRLCGV